MNSKPIPKVIKSKVATSMMNGGTTKTQNLHSHASGSKAVRAGKKHSAQNSGGKLAAC